LLPAEIVPAVSVQSKKLSRMVEIPRKSPRTRHFWCFPEQ